MNRIITILFFLLAGLTVIAQPLVTNDGLAIRVDASLTVTVQGAVVNQDKGASTGSIDNAGTLTLTGDWTNNSASNVFITTTTGWVNFIGSAAGQIITGTAATSFYNLDINNTFATSPQITLGINTNALASLKMTQGNVNMATQTFTLGTDAITPGTLTHDGTFVLSGWMYDGLFTRYFKTSTVVANRTIASGLFPFGNSLDTYHSPFYVSCPVTAPDPGGTITVSNAMPNADAVTVSNVNFADGASTIIRRHDYKWTLATGIGLGLTTAGVYNISAGGNGFGQVGLVVPTTADLRLTQAGGVVATAGANAGTTADPIVNRNGLTLVELSNDFYISSVSENSPLPIELLSFDAYPVEKHVEIIWTTSTEINNDYFTIEKTKDGSNFEQVVIVDGAGNSSSLLNYFAGDENPFQGVSYYRLKQTDFNGDFKYSDLKMVEFENNSNFSFNVYPNPNSGSTINLEIKAEKGEEVLVVVYDAVGKESFSKVIITGESLNNIYAVDPSKKLAPGIYLITGTSNQKIYSKKLIVN